MKKIKRAWNRIMFWFLNRKESELEISGFKYIFRRYSMDVESLSGNFRLRLLCTEHPCGYLRASMEQNKKDNLHGYAILNYITATCLTKDSKLVGDLQRDIKGYYTRLERMAEKEAKRKAEKGEEMTEAEELGFLLNEKIVNK